jgi:3'-phosphoadenosine 5'-phosphosulfate sulfotransferase (PAPS reductase)/FAD synthetase
MNHQPINERENPVSALDLYPRRLPRASRTIPAHITPLAGERELEHYDVVTVSTSAGKDSQAMLWAICQLADKQGYPRERIVAIHADLGRAEWQGTEDLARAQAQALGLRFEVCRKKGSDLLERVLERFESRPDVPSWFSPSNRWCTSDFKRGPIRSVLTKLVRELRPKGKAGLLSVDCFNEDCYADPGEPCVKKNGQAMVGFHKERREDAKRRPRVQILTCLGMRAGESNARSKLQAFEVDKGASNSLRDVDKWLPIHDWSVGDVWAAINESGLPYHRAYDLGMPRLSCALCIFATDPALLLAGEHNRDLLDAYVEVEDEVGYTFKSKTSLRSIRDRLDAGERQLEPITTWEECA